MIIIEYLNAQFQVDTTSHAIISKRQSNNNPAMHVYLDTGFYYLEFTGLNNGTEDIITGTPRANHFDFYIGMDDLTAQRNLFPVTTAISAGLRNDGLRNPTKKVRSGGVEIAWRGPLARFEVCEISINLVPFKIKSNSDEVLILNIDKEFSKYPIDNGNGQTTRELHFGFGENSFVIRRNATIRVPRILVKLTPIEYATVLEAIDFAINLHRI